VILYNFFLLGDVHFYFENGIYTKNSEDAERIFTTRRSRLDRIIYESGEVFIFSEEPFFDE